MGISRFVAWAGIVLWGLFTLISVLLAVNYRYFVGNSDLSGWTIPFSIVFLLLGIYFASRHSKHAFRNLRRLLVWQIGAAAAATAIVFSLAINGPTPIYVEVESSVASEVEGIAWETTEGTLQGTPTEIPKITFPDMSAEGEGNGVDHVEDGNSDTEEEYSSLYIPLSQPSDNHMGITLVFLAWLAGAALGMLLLEPLRAKEDAD